MIKILLKRIWTQRKINFWLFILCMIVSFFLIFLVDFTNILFRNYTAPAGLEVNKENTYYIQFETDYDSPDKDYAGALHQIRQRLEENHQIEEVSLFYDIGTHKYKLYKSEEKTYCHTRAVDAHFFKIFSHSILYGGKDLLSTQFEKNWSEENALSPIVIDELAMQDIFFLHAINEEYRAGRSAFQEGQEEQIINQVINSDSKIVRSKNTLVSVANNVRFQRLDNRANIYVPINQNMINTLSDPQFAIKVKEGTKLDITPFEIGPFFLSRIESIDENIERVYSSKSQYGMQLVLIAIVLFFLINLLIGVLGSFWQRTLKRSNEIGLQLAIGATPTRIVLEISGEALLLITMAFLPAFVLASFLYYNEIGVFMSNSLTVTRFFHVVFISYAIMAVLTVMGILFPTLKAAQTNPARVLMKK